MATYFVTGANRGIGLAFCEYLLNRGDDVWAASRTHSNRKALGDLKEKNNRLNLVDLDLMFESDIASVKSHLDGKKIDVLINVAGVFDLPDADFTDGFSAWDAMFKVNTVGPALLGEALLSNLRQSNEAKVVNISSNMASIALNEDGIYMPYRVTKAALNALTKNYAVKWRPLGIAVIALHPGWVRTDMGGPDGQLSPHESVTMMHQLIQNVAMKDTGKFFTYNKEELPW